MIFNYERKILYTPSELNQLILDDKVTLVDVRDNRSFNNGHINGAVNIPEVFTYLSMSSDRALKRFQNKFKNLFSEAGVSEDKKVIFYAEGMDLLYGGSCRGYWIITYLGHPEAGILHGGLRAWLFDGFDINKKKSKPEKTNFQITPQPDIMATVDDVIEAVHQPDILLLDTRDKAEWIGASSSPYGIDYVPRKGHIPGSRWIEWYNCMDTKDNISYFKSPGQIRSLYKKSGFDKEQNIIIYCFKGSRASNTYIALKMAGYNKLRVYFASWNEWAKIPKLPIERG